MATKEAFASISEPDLNRVNGGGFGDWMKRNYGNIVEYANPVTAPFKIAYEEGKWAYNTTYRAGYNQGRSC